jgi:trehalose 6-phosphate synthase
MPIRYLRIFAAHARRSLVTPLHDGMNLVAKEYVAAQNPFNPGVLVLSSFAGAAKELDAGLLVNPNDIDGMAQQITTALRATPLQNLFRHEKLVSTLIRIKMRALGAV